MKTRTAILSTIALMGVALMSFTFNVKEGDYSVDNKASEVKWKGHKVTGEHWGDVGVKDANLMFNDGHLVGGTVVINMASIEVKDLEGEYKGKLEGHLKSDDFFGVAKYPTATLKILKATPKSNSNTYDISASITIKGHTEKINFTATAKQEGSNFITTSAMKIDRTKFDIRYGSGSFFDNLGDKTIYDEFDLEVRIVTDLTKTRS